MSRARVWAVVEGANHDTPFYEGLLTDGAGVTATEFVRAEDIEVDGTAAGGKSHALKVFHVLEKIGGLQQENNETKIDVLFFLDRDDDDYLGSLIENDHVQYTHYADVEAEIISHANLSAAISRAFSVPRAEAAIHAPIDPAFDLASLWAEWITLRLASGDCGWSDTRFAQPSGINVPLYGDVDALRVGPICRRVKEERSDWEQALERARTYVSAEFARGDVGRLVKGKWLPSFIVYLVVQSLSIDRPLPRVDAAHLTTACLMSIDFKRTWADRYAQRLEPVLSR